ncbi:MAG: hypothetical protein KDK36_14090 [Leptospiraceae bacterium]|nr:hypothetical protein [Leptospiraceae bacterium]
MRFLVQDKNRVGISWIFEIMLNSLYQGFFPIVFSGESGFPFLFFLDYTRRYKIPFSLTSRLLSASAVNMHHVYSILRQIQKMSPEYYPIFVDFSRHYLDENVSEWSSRSIFKRDMNLVRKISGENKPILFYESGRGRSTHRHPFFRREIYVFSEVCLSISATDNSVQKFSITSEEEVLHGSANYTLYCICSAIVPGLEKYSKIPAQGRPEILRSILSDSKPEHSGGEYSKSSVSDGDGLFPGGSGTSERD